MDNIFIIIPAFIFTITLLVAIHEYGHFWVARKFNVKILRFSIGFGPALFTFKGKKDDTEYVLAGIPLGGYVKMLDEREAEVSEQEVDRAFNRQSVGKRFAIVFAGPFVNFVFAVFAFWLMYIIGIQGVKPIMGVLETDSIAWQSGLRSGDYIVAVDEQDTPTISAVYEQLLEAFVSRQNTVLALSDKRHIDLKFDSISNDIEASELHQIVGLSVQLPKEKVIISEVTQGSAAEKSGMLAGDQILSIDGKVIDHWHYLVKSIISKPNETVEIVVLRQSVRKSLSVTIAEFKKGNTIIGRIGVRPKAVKSLDESMYANHQYGFIDALPEAVNKTWNLSLLTLKMFGKMIIGQASLKNISGPISIAEVVGDSVQMGIEFFLRVLAIISLSLGVINLLPIPMLDGGHLFFYLIEMLKGSPVSDEIQEFGIKIGVALLVMLMSIAMYNDFTRLLN